MKRSKLISGYRLPERYQHTDGRAGVFRNRQLFVDDKVLDLGKFMANGAFGMIFAKDTYIIKLELSEEPKPLEMDLNNWASESGYGPRFWGWGKLEISPSDLNALVSEMVSVSTMLPHWYNELFSTAWHVYYSVFEKWDMDLRTWLRSQPKPQTALYSIDERVMRKLATGVKALHKKGVIHFDLLPKNILVNVEQGAVIDIAMTDFGNVISKEEWYFQQTSEIRRQFVRYLLEHKELEVVGQWLLKEYPDPNYNAYNMAYMWLMLEPHNFDWALLTCYNIGAPTHQVQTVPYPEMPPYFNFSLPWSTEGYLEVYVKYDDKTKYLGPIYGLWTLERFRETMSSRFPKLKSRGLLRTQQGKARKISSSQENYLTVSSVVEAKSFIIKFSRRDY